MDGPTEQAAQGAAACRPCRGTGRVISALGGEPHELPCPWCGGTGELTLGRDAQESPAESQRNA